MTPTSESPEPIPCCENPLKIIRELRNALFVASNRYHELHLRCAYIVQNELQFRTLVEAALSESEKYKPEYETGDPLDWRRRNE